MLRMPLPPTYLPGLPEALRSILDTNEAFLYARLTTRPLRTPRDQDCLFAHVFGAVAATCAALVGPAQWDLRGDSLLVRQDAKLVLEYFSRYVPYRQAPSTSTQLEALDIYPTSRIRRRQASQLRRSVRQTVVSLRS